VPKEHVVQQGECVSSIAFDNGFFPETIWNDPSNTEAKKARKSRNVLYEGDVLVIPDKRQKDEPCSTEARHRFRRKGIPEILKVRLVDEHDHPRANVKYVLTIDGVSCRGTTDGHGGIREVISPGAQEGCLIIGNGESSERIDLYLGFLDPVDKISGVQMRLRNLGYDCGSIGDDLTPQMIEGLEQFQGENGLEVTGDLDEQTKKKLLDLHGS